MKTQTTIYQLNYDHYNLNNGTQFAILNEDNEYINIVDGRVMSQRKHSNIDDRGLISATPFIFDGNIFQVLNLFKRYRSAMQEYNSFVYNINKDFNLIVEKVPTLDNRWSKTNPKRLEIEQLRLKNKQLFDNKTSMIEDILKEINNQFVFPEGFAKREL